MRSRFSLCHLADSMDNSFSLPVNVFFASLRYNLLNYELVNCIAADDGSQFCRLFLFCKRERSAHGFDCYMAENGLFGGGPIFLQAGFHRFQRHGRLLPVFSVPRMAVWTFCPWERETVRMGRGTNGSLPCVIRRKRR